MGGRASTLEMGRAVAAALRERATAVSVPQTYGR
jgi:hypothetical protein